MREAPPLWMRAHGSLFAHASLFVYPSLIPGPYLESLTRNKRHLMEALYGVVPYKASIRGHDRGLVLVRGKRQHLIFGAFLNMTVFLGK